MRPLNLISCNSLRITNKKLQQTLEKLSSGIRINKAGDGPAELAVSQSMRADIVALERTQKNAEDGISLVTTAEGALAEVHEMLNRLTALSEQAANGIYEENDRASLEREVSQLKSEIDRIAETTHFNGIPLLNGSLAGTDGSTDAERVQVFQTVDDITGAEYQNAVQAGASWEGEIDFYTIADGTTLTINGVTFEFDTDGVQNDAGAIAVRYAASSNDQTVAAALEASILGSSLADDLDSCAVVNAGVRGSYNIKLVQKDRAAENGKGFMVSAGISIPQVKHGAVNLKGTIGMASSRLEIEDIDLNTIVDGTIFEYFGDKFEVDYDGITTNNGTRILNLDVTGSGTKASKLEQLLNGVTPAATGSFKALAGSASGLFRFQIKYNTSYTTPSTSDLRFNTTPYAVPDIQVKQNKVGIDTPEILPKNAMRTDEIDFSLFQDGDTITIAGNTFEFDADGDLKNASHAVVDISTIADPSEMAAALKAAFDSNGLSGFTMTTTAVDSNRARLKVSADSPVKGQKIEFAYKVAKAEENKEVGEVAEGGLTLKIGSGEKGDLRIKLESIATEALGISAVSVSTQEAASKSMKIIREAVNQISEQRGDLGAIHNRLEHAINNLGVTRENLTAAESRIRDTDMAKEMMKSVKFQILGEAARSVMAQSNNVAKTQVQQILQM